MLATEIGRRRSGALNVRNPAATLVAIEAEVSAARPWTVSCTARAARMLNRFIREVVVAWAGARCRRSAWRSAPAGGFCNTVSWRSDQPVNGTPSSASG